MGADNTVPREIPTRQMHFSGASRADVAVRCNTAGNYELTAINGNKIADVVVTDDVTAPDATLTTFNPLRPRYLRTLLNEPNPSEIVNIDFTPVGSGIGINCQLWQ
eukprot:315256_1